MANMIDAYRQKRQDEQNLAEASFERSQTAAIEKNISAALDSVPTKVDKVYDVDGVMASSGGGLESVSFKLKPEPEFTRFAGFRGMPVAGQEDTVIDGELLNRELKLNASEGGKFVKATWNKESITDIALRIDANAVDTITGHATAERFDVINPRPVLTLETDTGNEINVVPAVGAPPGGAFVAYDKNNRGEMTECWDIEHNPGQKAIDVGRKALDES